MRGKRPDDTDGTRRARHAAAPGRALFPRRTARAWAIGGGITVLLSAILVASDVVIGHHLTSRSSSPAPKPSTGYTAVPAAPPNATAAPGLPPSAAATPGLAPNVPAELKTAFAQLQEELDAQVGVVIGAVGSNQDLTVLGDWQHGPAWSTMKVPLTIAALLEQEPPPKATDQ